METSSSTEAAEQEDTGAGTEVDDEDEGTDDETGSTDGTEVETALTDETGAGTVVTGRTDETGAEMADTGDETVEMDEVETVDGADTEEQTLKLL